MIKQLPVSLNNLSPLSQEDVYQIYQDLSKLNYDNERGFGFREITVNSTTLNATLVKRTPIFIPEFDVKLSQIIRKEIYLFSEVDFSIDARYNLLEIFDTTKNVSKVRTTIRPLLNKNLRLSSVSFTPIEVITKLSKNALRLNIDGLSVNNFKYREGIVGRFEMKIENTELALDIIKKYSHDVTKATIRLTTDDFEDIFLKIYNTGRLIISCEEEDFDGILKVIKRILFEE